MKMLIALGLASAAALAPSTLPLCPMASPGDNPEGVAIPNGVWLRGRNHSQVTHTLLKGAARGEKGNPWEGEL